MGKHWLKVSLTIVALLLIPGAMIIMISTHPAFVIGYLTLVMALFIASPLQ